MNEALRDRVLDDLSGRFAQDQLGLEEYEQRVKAVSAARTDEELLRVNADILPPHRYLGANAPAPSGTRLTASSQAGPGMALINHGEAPNHRDAVAIFSSSDLSGEFIAPRKLDAVAIFGSTTIDLRKAAIPESGMSIETAAIFGGCTIILPEGVTPEISGTGIFGGFHKPRASFGTSGPVVRINGAAIFGGVDIRIQSPGGLPAGY